MSGANPAPSQAVQRLTEVMRTTSIDASGVARILDRDPKTVQRWLRHETAPRWEVREIVLALNVVLERLALVIDPAAAEDWLFTPVPSFEYRRPVELIRSGRAREVLNMIDGLGEGVFV
jgi:putative toxin-antitoxin system antitoxin component (TIGR02293 family)